MVIKLDFSEFHPLDHWPGTTRCRELPGGTRNHLRMSWSYKWSQALATWTWCRIGRHREVQAIARCAACDWQVEFTMCHNCGKRKP